MPKVIHVTGLAGLRRAALLSQRELAEHVGVNIRIVQSWESGEKSPRPQHQRRLVEVLGVTPAELLEAIGVNRFLTTS